MIHIEEFWQVADGDNWAPAFLRAQQSVTQRGGQSTPFELRFHAPRVYTFHDYADVISAVELKGEHADAANLPQLYFPDGHGLRTHFLGSYQPDLQAGSQLVIDGLWLQGSRATSTYAHHGIYCDTGFDIRNTRITNFDGDGLHVEATNSIQRPGGGFANAHFVYFQDQRDGATYSVTIRGQQFPWVAGVPAVATDIITALVSAVNRAFPMRDGPAVILGPPWTIHVDLALLNTEYVVQINGGAISINSGAGTPDPDTGTTLGSVTTQSIAQQLSDAINMHLNRAACFVSGFESITFDPSIGRIGIGPNLSIAGFAITTTPDNPWPFPLTAASTLPDGTTFQGLRVAYASNANNSRLDRLHCWNNGRHGVYIRGADANQGSFIGVDCQSNGHGGIVDLSFLGNKWYGAHVVSLSPTPQDPLQGINSFPYATNPGNSIVEFYGCYTEGSVPSWINEPSIVWGGIMAVRNWNRSGAQIYPQTFGASISPLLHQINRSARGDVVHLYAPDNTLTERTALAFSSSAEGAPTTTLQAAIAAPGLQAATPASMAGIAPGGVLTIDPHVPGVEETVVVTASTAATFTANFVRAHQAGAVVRVNLPVPDPWRLQHGGATDTYWNWWALTRNSDAQIALLIADAGNPFGVGTIWLPQQRVFFGGPAPGAIGNSIEWCDSNPPPGTPPHPAPPPVAGHTRGDIAFNRAGNPRAYIFDGNAWQPW